jgi:LPS O-antigen subunit length determinant protein (WzzB/FepE family)
MEQDKTYNDEVDLFELFQKLYERKWIILGITTFTTALAILVSIFMPKAYKAEAMVEVKQYKVQKLLIYQKFRKVLKFIKMIL